MSQEEFIQRSQNIHNGYYDYSLVAYTNSDTSIKIICPKHGIFEQRPYLHLRGSRCASCAKVKKKTTQQFICEAIDTHGNKYDYSLINYLGSNVKVEILCKDHGSFNMLPGTHTTAGQGCPKCTSSISLEETIWLNLIGIMDKYRQYKISVTDGSYLKVDGYDPEKNTVYEYNGDYYHGNPTTYNPLDINHRCGLTFGELYSKTLQREQLLRDSGYTVVSIWGSEFKKLYKTAIREYRHEHGSKKVCTVS